ncbi:DRTGG domain-containing protein [Brassicibacter mesophilus]|uniref:DRTGG domain-containing protein n=1 Tax=Brassicibacter mesophilus TaxID=745119 RepID=UPI003D23B14A
MDLSKIISELELEVVAGLNEDDVEVSGVYIGDLLSLVMSRAGEKNIWITIQTHLNIVAVATLVGMSGIIIAEGMGIDNDTIKKANQVNVPLLKSSLSAYELACKLNNLGI